MKVRHEKMTILSGKNVSNEVNVGGDLLVGIFMPEAVTDQPTLKLRARHPVSGDYVNFLDLSTYALNAYVPFMTGEVQGVSAIRLETVQNQAADREFVLALLYD